MQQRYDEAEAALKRALEMDPDYELARHNLANLPAARRSGLPPEMEVPHPFKGRKLKQTITFREE